ncbi:hypothetical protein VV01_06140 [Luteipulveratus halotolerans]|uniref:Methyltransferase type 11 domain-containing protein n=1 Tax=Luteipulveratus halotolerans TaxID=1631356 RepID=A0A0L6CNB5_9MICO|nr:hypothetical protein VV01_06140 [Luteipulveratus halotolerans]
MRSARPGDMAAYVGAKTALIGSLRGTVLEIGAGRGSNFGLLDRTVSWIGLEPRRRARRELEARAQRDHRRTQVIAGSAEDIAVPAASVDAVLSTVVLCSVDDQRRALAEVRRVLRPGGSFVFCEHVLADAGWTRLALQAFAPVQIMVDGCDPARDTEAAIRSAGFADVDIEHFVQPGPLGTRLPFIVGRASVA